MTTTANEVLAEPDRGSALGAEPDVFRRRTETREPPRAAAGTKAANADRAKAGSSRQVFADRKLSAIWFPSSAEGPAVFRLSVLPILLASLVWKRSGGQLGGVNNCPRSYTRR